MLLRLVGYGSATATATDSTLPPHHHHNDSSPSAVPCAGCGVRLAPRVRLCDPLCGELLPLLAL